jgi:hypothetical protein
MPKTEPKHVGSALDHDKPIDPITFISKFSTADCNKANLKPISHAVTTLYNRTNDCIDALSALQMLTK